MGKRKDGQAGAGAGKKKGRFVQHDYAGKGPGLPFDKQGIIITVETGDYMKAGKEAVNVLNEIWEDMRPADAGQAPQTDTTAGNTTDASAPAPAAETSGTKDADGDPAADAGTAKPKTTEAAPEKAAGAQDFSALIEGEVSDLKDKKQHAFRFYDTGIKTLLFLEMPFATKEVVQRLLEKAKKDKVLQFRHCARFLPCTHVCRADKAAIAETAKAVAEDAFASGADAEGQTVAVLYEHRANSPGLKRPEVIDAVIEAVPRPPHSVKLKGAKKTISVQVVRNACGMAVIDDYHDLGKYNIKTLCADEEDAAEAAEAAK